MSLKSLPCSPLLRAREIYAVLLALDVLNGCYDAEIACDPRTYAMRITAGLELADVRRMTNELRAERRKLAKLGLLAF